MASSSAASRRAFLWRAGRIGQVVVLVFVVAVGIGIARGQQVGMRATAIPSPTVPVPADVTANVALSAASHPSLTQVGTNLTAYSEVSGATDPAHGRLLQHWSPPLVRLHLGYTGEVTLPEATLGNWDFTKLDTAIGQLRAAHIPFFVNIRTGPAWMYDASGQLRDGSYQEFARYMARLVGWYNKGGFTDDAGHFHASGHTNWVTTWEIWNEPNSGYDIPVTLAHPSATWLYATKFARLYSVASFAMRAVDPTIRTGGPTISAYPDDGYVIDFIKHVTAPLDFFSFHFYAIGNQQAPDPDAFAAVSGKFAHRLALARATLDAYFPGKAIPIWIDEVGYNEVSRYPVDPRGAAPVGIAFAADTFITAAQAGVTQFTQFPFLGNAQLALGDNQTFKPYVSLRFYETLARTFPAGVRLLPATLSRSTGTVVLAALAPDGTSLRVLVANLAVAHATDVNGAGVPETVRVTLTDTLAGATAHAGTAAALWSFDATTDPSRSAAAQPLPVFAADGQVSVQVALGGYGVAIVQIPLK